MNRDLFQQKIMPRVEDFMAEAIQYSDTVFVLCGHKNSDGGTTYAMCTNDEDFSNVAEGICANEVLFKAINNLIYKMLEASDHDEKIADELINNVFKKKSLSDLPK